MKISISISAHRLPFYKDCSQFSEHDTDKEGGLSDMIQSGLDISYRTFRSKVNDEDWNSLVSNMGYDKSFKIQDDYAVRFKKGKLFGKQVYFLQHSRIEYIFGDLR